MRINNKLKNKLVDYQWTWEIPFRINKRFSKFVKKLTNRKLRKYFKKEL